MLQVSNLTKIYKTKGGVEVKALDNVSVSFPETGMVFLLGKSGSGKSTLLNVCGGLDSPTDGEIIVKGRSSKNFSQSDFDSYRNTYIGFIFQEYNILNEFSVEDNIALALELQGKPKDKKAIAQLLDDVDLSGYAKRKPNTLSGGQKQRIAIARALIKAPEIIMADEPTGALDSNTGKQVLDTLKKLSQSKLVLVVSHDRDFAEQYGDRIIELKDGQIISDITKTHAEQRAVSDNVTFIGNTVSVKNGANLTDKDFNEIKAFLKNVNGDIMIASGEQEIKDFRAVSHITEDGQKEIFRDTDESEIESKTYTAKESKFIRSRLPARHAFKIGVSSLKTKPIRLFFTILLCTVAFVLFGLASTMTFYDSEATFKQSFLDSNLATMRLIKEYREQVTSYYNGSEDYTWDNYYNAGFTAEEVDAYTKKFGSDAFGAIKVREYLNTQSSLEYWSTKIEHFATLSNTNTLRQKIIGNYPQNEDEILFSSYTVNALKEAKGYDASGNSLELQNIEDIIGKTISLKGKAYKVVGILEVDELPAKFDTILENNNADWNIYMEFESALNDSLRLVAFVTQEELSNIANNTTNQNEDNFGNKNIYIATADENGKITFPEDTWGNGYYAELSHIAPRVTYFEAGKTGLTTTQTVIRARQFFSLLYYPFESLFTEAHNAYWNAYNNWVTKYESLYSEWKDKQIQNGEGYIFESISDYSDQWLRDTSEYIPTEGDDLYEWYQDWKVKVYAPYLVYEKWDKLLTTRNVLLEGNEWIDGNYTPLTQARREELTNLLLQAVKEHNITLQVGAMVTDFSNTGKGVGEQYYLEVVGIVDLYKDVSNSWTDVLYLDDAFVKEIWTIQKSFANSYTEYQTNYTVDANEIYSTIFLPYDHSTESTNMLHEIYANMENLDERDTRVKISCSLTATIETVDSFILEMSKIFLIAGIVMATFAALLLSNFISVSISHKKRDIGILRAVGARGADVFKIFFSESFVITTICVAISLVGSVALCMVLNTEIGAGLGVSIFNFGVFSLATLLGIALLTAIVATFLPVWLTAKKKPVDSIRSL